MSEHANPGYSTEEHAANNAKKEDREGEGISEESGTTCNEIFNHICLPQLLEVII